MVEINPQHIQANLDVTGGGKRKPTVENSMQEDPG